MIQNNRLVFALTLILGLALAACGGGTPATDEPATYSSEQIAQGEETFVGACSACHGPEGTGVEGLGKDLTSSDWVSSQSDAELFDFITTGRPASDALNTTGVDMPPKGGNPALSDDDINAIIAFIRSIER